MTQHHTVSPISPFRDSLTAQDFITMNTLLGELGLDEVVCYECGNQMTHSEVVNPALGNQYHCTHCEHSEHYTPAEDAHPRRKRHVS